MNGTTEDNPQPSGCGFYFTSLEREVLKAALTSWLLDATSRFLALQAAGYAGDLSLRIEAAGNLLKEL